MLHYTGNKASKNHAMAACSRDNDPAKEPGWWSACFASNANYFYHRAVISHSWYLQIMRDNEFEDIACMSVS